jgi:pyridoxine kinase
MEQILSIQSTVTIGFVGNNVAGPVITHLGHQPLLVNTVALAAHPGYGLFAGGPMPDAIFSAILRALSTLGRSKTIGTVITGYLGALTQVNAISQFVKAWQLEQTGGFYILDPVLGDNGRIYVDNKLVTAMRDNLLPLANFVTPNQFELELLSGKTVRDVPSADQAARYLLEQYPHLKGVLVTGINHIDNSIHDRFIGQNELADMTFKKRTSGIAGGGDLLTTIFSSWLASGHSFESSFKAASEQAHSIIDRSDNHLEIKLLENIDLVKPIPKL